MDKYGLTVSEVLGDRIIVVTKNVVKMEKISFATEPLIKNKRTFAVMIEDDKKAPFYIARRVEVGEQFRDMDKRTLRAITSTIPGRILLLWINGHKV